MLAVDLVLIVAGWALSGVSGWLVVRQFPAQPVPVRRIGFGRTDGSRDWLSALPMLAGIAAAVAGCSHLQLRYGFGTWAYLLFLPVLLGLPGAAVVHNLRVQRLAAD